MTFKNGRGKKFCELIMNSAQVVFDIASKQSVIAFTKSC